MLAAVVGLLFFGWADAQFVNGRRLEPPVPSLCALRTVHENVNGKGYYFSWRDSRTSDQEEDWLGARNWCRLRCMDSVSLLTKEENEFIKSRLVRDKVKYIWTSGRLCDFKGCDRPDLQPKRVNGWFWTSDLRKLAPTTDRSQNDWSPSGGLKMPQPDNREERQNGSSENCLAVLNNFYGDGVHWHDVACHHRKPFVCKDNEELIKYVRYTNPNLRILLAELNELDFIASLLDDPEGSPDGANLPVSDPPLIGSGSEVHKGDTDSSDDEDNKYFETSQYNCFGREIKSKLKELNRVDHTELKKESWKKTQKNLASNLSLSEVPKSKGDVYTEPIFGLRIINPLVSSQILRERMNGKVPISFMKVKNHVAHGDLNTDWVIGGVIISKSNTKISQKGSQYMVWRLSDLKDKLLTVSVFLFGKSYGDLWKTTVGSVIGILNPNVLNNKDSSKDEATLSIFNSDQVMIWGTSKDFGFCKAKKKNGENCTNFVNLNQCEFCVHHVKTEYRKFTGRSELQSSTGGSLVNLRNKVLGKNEVFYGGKIFTSLSVPSKQSKVPQKDKTRLGTLGVTINEKPVNKSISKLPHCPRSVELLKLLSDSSKNERNDASEIKQISQAKSLKLKNGEICKTNGDRFQSNEIKFPSLSDPSLDESLKGIKKPQQKLNVIMGAEISNKRKMSTNNLKTRFNSLAAVSVLEKNNHINSSKKELTVVPNSEKSQDASKEKKETGVTSTQTKLNVVSSSPSIQIPSPEASSNIVKLFSECPNPKTNEPGVESASTNTVKIFPEYPNPKMDKTGVESLYKQSPKCLSHNRSQKLTKAKAKALQFIRQNGPINNEVVDKGKKRTLQSEEEDEGNNEKKFILSERFIELMNRPPVNEELVIHNETKRFDEYYEKMEKKEQMEEKMLNTFKIECKAVKCLKCKYTWFSASEMCKSEGHPIKVVDAEKRFFKCGKCSNRTISLEIIPLISCRNCGSSNWLKAPMIREKVKTASVTLSIRGGEQKFINSQVTDANLDLLVAGD